MTKYKKYEKNNMKFWVYSDKVTIQISNLQVVRYDIYTTANKRNFYTFKKSLVALLSDEGKTVTMYDIMSLGQASRIHSTAALRPKDE